MQNHGFPLKCFFYSNFFSSLKKMSQMKSRSFTKLHSWLKVTLSSKQPINDMYNSRRWKHCALKGIMLVFLSYESFTGFTCHCSWFELDIRCHSEILYLTTDVWVEDTGHKQMQTCVFFFTFALTFFSPLFSVSDVSVWPGLKRYRERVQTDGALERNPLCWHDRFVHSCLFKEVKWPFFFIIVPLTGLNRILNLSVKSVPYSAKWFAV